MKIKIQNFSFPQELNLDEANVRGGAFNSFSFNPLTQFQFTSQNVSATSGGGNGSNTIGSPAVAVGIQIPVQIGLIIAPELSR